MFRFTANRKIQKLSSTNLVRKIATPTFRNQRTILTTLESFFEKTFELLFFPTLAIGVAGVSYFFYNSHKESQEWERQYEVEKLTAARYYADNIHKHTVVILAEMGKNGYPSITQIKDYHTNWRQVHGKIKVLDNQDFEVYVSKRDKTIAYVTLK